jgi:hypothetical protein
MVGVFQRLSCKSSEWLNRRPIIKTTSWFKENILAYVSLGYQASIVFKIPLVVKSDSEWLSTRSWRGSDQI